MRHAAVIVSSLGLAVASVAATALRAQPSPLGPEFILDSGPEVAECPSVAAALFGGAALLWTRLPTPHATQVVARGIDPGGPRAKLAVIAGWSLRTPGLSTSLLAGGDDYTASWRDPVSSGQPYRSTVLDLQGEPIETSHRIGHGTSFVTLRPVGGFVAVRTTHKGRTLTFDLLDSTGGVVAPPRQIVRTRAHTLPVPAAVLHAPDGSFVVVWLVFDRRGGNLRVFGRRFDEAGLPVGPRAISFAPPDTFGGVRVALGAGGTLAATSGGGAGTTLRIFSGSGQSLSGDVLLGPPGTVVLALAVAEDDRVLVVGGDLSPLGVEALTAQLFSPQGAPLGDEVEIASANTEKPTIHCSSALWSAQGWLVSWVRSTRPVASYDVVARWLTP